MPHHDIVEACCTIVRIIGLNGRRGRQAGEQQDLTGCQADQAGDQHHKAGHKRRPEYSQEGEIHEEEKAGPAEESTAFAFFWNDGDGAAVL